MESMTVSPVANPAHVLPTLTQHLGGPNDPRMTLIEVKSKVKQCLSPDLINGKLSRNQYIAYWKSTSTTLGFVKEIAQVSSSPLTRDDETQHTDTLFLPPGYSDRCRCPNWCPKTDEGAGYREGETDGVGELFQVYDRRFIGLTSHKRSASKL